MKLLQGNEAVVEGMIAGGATYFAGYPITPASEAMHYFALRASQDKNLTFIQKEDEIASFHSLLGGSLAGRKVFTTTSGPGFSLMQEGIGLAYAMEVPLVLVNVMRQGPSTGMPTIGAQGDLGQVRYGTHGDYSPLALYPNSIEEIYKYSQIALNLAEEALSPVILLADGFLAQMYETADLEKIKIAPLKRTYRAFGSNLKRHLTGLTNLDGTPKTTDPVACKKWLTRLSDKIKKVAKHYRFYEYQKKSDTLIISFGAVSRAISEITAGHSHFRPITIYPVLEKELARACGEHKKIVVVEMNDGQYAEIVERLAGRKVERVSICGGDLSYANLKKLLKTKL